MRLHHPSLSLLAAAVLSACSMAPAYERPQAPVAEQWQSVQDKAEPGAQPPGNFAEIAWRDFFSDTRLCALIERALEHNRDLRVATLTAEQVRAQYRIQAAEQFPAIAAVGGQTAQHTPADLSMTGREMTSRTYSATVGLASYELDFFGRVRSLKDKALADYLASVEAARSVRNTVIAETARAWVNVAAQRELLALAEDTLKSRRQSLDLVQRSFDAGAVSALDVAQAQTAAESARITAAQQKTAFDQAYNALVLLTGASVEDVLLPAHMQDGFAALPDLSRPINSEILLSRPDILAAEQQLKAANANIGAARAAFFPSITLTASTGVASSELDNLFSSGHSIWSFVPQISLPIFTAGKLSASLDAAEIGKDIAVARYEQAIQTSFREVADALAARATLSEQLSAGEALATAARENERLSDARYRSGLDSHLNLLDAQRTRNSAEQSLIVTRFSDASNRITLYKLLGGGIVEEDTQVGPKPAQPASSPASEAAPAPAASAPVPEPAPAPVSEPEQAKMPAATGDAASVPEDAPVSPDAADDVSEPEETLIEVIEVLKEPEEVPVQEEVSAPPPEPAPEVEILHSSEGGSLRMEILPAEEVSE